MPRARMRSTMLLWPACVAMLAALPARVRARALGGAPSVAPSVSGAAPCVGVDVDGWCLPTPRCAMNALDLDGLCVDRAGATAEGALTLATNAHTERSGRRVLYEHLPRRPDLPADYDRYVYPLDAPARGSIVASGYDLDRPDVQQRRGASLSAVGHGGVDILRERGAPVRAVSLRGEVGAAEVLFVGPLFGNTVALRHVVRDGDVTRTYLALHGHLDHPAPGVAKGVTVEPGTVLGFVGDSGAEGVVHLHYEVRLVRAGVDPARVEPAALTNQSVSVPCDPRNVLPFR